MRLKDLNAQWTSPNAPGFSRFRILAPSARAAAVVLPLQVHTELGAKMQYRMRRSEGVFDFELPAKPRPGSEAAAADEELRAKLQYQQVTPSRPAPPRSTPGQSGGAFVRSMLQSHACGIVHVGSSSACGRRIRALPARYRVGRVQRTSFVCVRCTSLWVVIHRCVIVRDARVGARVQR